MSYVIPLICSHNWRKCVFFFSLPVFFLSSATLCTSADACSESCDIILKTLYIPVSMYEGVTMSYYSHQPVKFSPQERWDVDHVGVSLTRSCLGGLQHAEAGPPPPLEIFNVSLLTCSSDGTFIKSATRVSVMQQESNRLVFLWLNAEHSHPFGVFFFVWFSFNSVGQKMWTSQQLY